MAIAIGSPVKLLLFVVSSFWFLHSVANGQISLEAVLKDCEKKTIVMGRDEQGRIVKVGERISGYCQGILEGIFAVLVHTQTICAERDDRSPEFLLSAVLTYRAETKSQDNDLVSVVEAAYKRAFSCTK